MNEPPTLAVTSTTPFPAFVFSPYVTSNPEKSVMIVLSPDITDAGAGLITAPVYSNAPFSRTSVSSEMSYGSILNV